MPKELSLFKEIHVFNANSVNPDQTLYSALFANYPFRGFLTKMG